MGRSFWKAEKYNFTCKDSMPVTIHVYPDDEESLTRRRLKFTRQELTARGMDYALKS